MLSSRRAFITGAFAILAGCGFAPVYGPDGRGAKLRGQIEFFEPGDRNAFALVSQLENRLGRTESPVYQLSVSIALSTDGLAVTSDQATTRFNVIGTARYALRDLDDKLLTDGTVKSFTGYSTTGTTVATQAAERDAYDRLMTALADQIVTRLIAASDGF
ncbi:LPS assembly lipoprotein LptE [Parasulfitobacter algicola]|uniref:LPS-assembly lipoprotein n=1 Tax=Parasulfitobacter algicola TaxID=2614809 RepID=A0ABX2IU36_9RHOB|nr:LPS assembly lipoprotein LptE [Sulfitobacter algicola]NSX53796.1 hypothetical protein [Sulfitobacter algicola]